MALACLSTQDDALSSDELQFSHPEDSILPKPCCYALQMVLACLMNKGDALLCDEYTYSHLVEAMMGPKGYVPVPVAMDDYGMTPEALETVAPGHRTQHTA